MAIKAPLAAGKRFILNSRTLWFREVALSLAKAYPSVGIKTSELPFCPVKFLSFFNSQIKGIVTMWDKDINFDNKQSQEILKITYRDPEESIVAMAEALYEFGQIPKKSKN